MPFHCPKVIWFSTHALNTFEVYHFIEETREAFFIIIKDVLQLLFHSCKWIQVDAKVASEHNLPSGELLGPSGSSSTFSFSLTTGNDCVRRM